MSRCTLQHKKNRAIFDSVCLPTLGTGHRYPSFVCSSDPLASIPAWTSEPPTDGPYSTGTSDVLPTQNNSYILFHCSLNITLYQNGSQNQVTNISLPNDCGVCTQLSTLHHTGLCSLSGRPLYDYLYTQDRLCLGCSNLWFNNGGMGSHLLSDRDIPLHLQESLEGSSKNMSSHNNSNSLTHLNLLTCGSASILLSF